MVKERSRYITIDDDGFTLNLIWTCPEVHYFIYYIKLAIDKNQTVHSISAITAVTVTVAVTCIVTVSTRIRAMSVTHISSTIRLKSTACYSDFIGFH